jgi:RNase P/RNase MRP subunit p30
MRKFADLHVKLSNLNVDVLARTGQIARDMGIDLLGITVPQTINESQISTIRDVFTKKGMDIAMRVDLSPRDRNRLLSDLRSVRKRFEIVAVECRSLGVAMVACRDRRVDTVSFPINNWRVRFRRSLARLCRGSLELDIAQLILKGDSPRHVILSRLRDEVSTAKRNHVPIILSSGADNPFLLRAPREIAAVGTLLGLESVEAINSVSTIPFAVTEENRKKLSPDHVTIGVKLAKVNKSNA